MSSVLKCPLFLTHWGRATHICVGKLTIIASDNGLSPERRQAIIWTNSGIFLIRPLGTNFSEIFIGNQTFSFMKMHLKMSSAKWRPFCLSLNVLSVLLPMPIVRYWLLSSACVCPVILTSLWLYCRSSVHCGLVGLLCCMEGEAALSGLLRVYPSMRDYWRWGGAAGVGKGPLVKEGTIALEGSSWGWEACVFPWRGADVVTAESRFAPS